MPRCSYCSRGYTYNGPDQECSFSPMLAASILLVVVYTLCTAATVLNILLHYGRDVLGPKGATARAVLVFTLAQVVDQLTDTLFLSSLPVEPTTMIDGKGGDLYDHTSLYIVVFSVIVAPVVLNVLLVGTPAALAFARRKVFFFKVHTSLEVFLADGLLFTLLYTLSFPLVLIYALLHTSNVFVWRPFFDATERVIHGGGASARAGAQPLADSPAGGDALLATKVLSRSALIGALFESLPQLVLQSLIARLTGQVSWQLYISIAVSSYMIARSLFTALYSILVLRQRVVDLELFVSEGRGGGKLVPVSSSPTSTTSRTPTAGRAPPTATVVVSSSAAGGGATGDVVPLPPPSAPLPSGWHASLDLDGVPFFFHPGTLEVSPHHPALPPPPLAQGWVELTDPKGRAFYADKHSGRALYARPVAATAVAHLAVQGGAGAVGLGSGV